MIPVSYTHLDVYKRQALDNVIDINYYPTKPAETSNRRHRPIGLGIMGLHNALYKKDLAFASAEAVEFNDEFMEAIAFYAYEASSDLAAERGKMCIRDRVRGALRTLRETGARGADLREGDAGD